MNEKLLYYRGYSGDVHYSQDDSCYYGTVRNIKGLVTYEGKTLEELEEDFYGAVDDYLEYQQNLKEQ
ncbi:hypothetical protein [Blautia obeum]|uniref:Antitoxin HicB n=1 Tax=Blautia obeum TaxID=40520 RepID=A0A414K5C2_9FIRM|nr:hypothetical protein [Blautia obeum]RHE69280.1 hypothetical protein DW723_16965 [Blautia obeum]